MDSLKNSIENLTGMLSVGSLCLLGDFLFLDRRTDIFHVLETYGQPMVHDIRTLREYPATSAE
jgi:hypothetical protein